MDPMDLGAFFSPERGTQHFDTVQEALKGVPEIGIGWQAKEPVVCMAMTLCIENKRQTHAMLATPDTDRGLILAWDTERQAWIMRAVNVGVSSPRGFSIPVREYMFGTLVFDDVVKDIPFDFGPSPTELLTMLAECRDEALRDQAAKVSPSDVSGSL